jgi:hypothetical protein
VLDYEVNKAFLYVEHQHGQDAAQDVSTAIEITQVLSTVKSTDLQAGSWLNVIGYVRRSLPRKSKRKRANDPTLITLPHVIVQAILIWNAGAVKISDYESMLSHQQEVKRLAQDALVERLQE